MPTSSHTMSCTDDDTMRRSWTDPECDILFQMTKAQIALEREDSSHVISWSNHWQNVSFFLKGRGYNRSPGACQIYWRRSQEAQHKNREPAAEEYDKLYPNNEPPPSTRSNIATPPNSKDPSPHKRHILQESNGSMRGTSAQPKKRRAQYIQDAIDRGSVSLSIQMY